MKRIILHLVVLSVLGTTPCLSHAQEDVTVVAPTSEAAEGLDLQAVADIFKDAKNLATFEKALNDPEVGVNNLDLDDNGEVDYIRVVEEAADETHVIILQVPLAKDEFQDVATIEVEKTADDAYNLQCHGNEVIYGADYYVQPTHVHIHTWPIITWMYGPVYRPYRSAFYFGVYPRWWRPYRPVTFRIYRTRTVKYTRGRPFTIGRTTRVTTVRKVNYTPRSSTRVKKTTAVTRTKSKTVRGKKTTVTKTRRTTVKKGTKKTTRTRKTVKKTRTAKPKKANQKPRNR